MKKNFIKKLEKRNLIVQISNKKKIIKKIKKKNINIYCGFDLTNNSLHLGHLIPLITLKRLSKYGYKIIILLGGSTSIIGDPSFKKRKKNINLKKNISNYTKKITLQIKNFFKNNRNIFLLNNKKWLNNMKVFFFLTKIGKFFNINQMLNKEAIKNRNSNKGITFKELSYCILQSYDFLYLYKKFNINLQIGGSDQWGNITSGIHLIKKKYNKEVFGITLPLMIKKNGIKFGKTENNALWLDPKKTTPYEFYQFWLNIPDKQVSDFLKQITFLKIKKIENILKNKNINLAKKILAKEITKIIHGKKEFKNIKFSTDFFFKKNKWKNNKKYFYKLFKLNIPKLSISTKITFLKEIILKLNITNSKSQAHNLILNKSIYINYNIISNVNYYINKKDKYFNKFTLISKGKKKFFILKWKNK